MTTIEVMRKALEALEAVAPYTDSLICYASTISEHQPNAIDGNVSSAITALRAELERLEAAEPVALGAPIAPEHDAELAAHAERAEQLHAEFLLAQKTYAYNTPGIARCARMAATPEGRRLMDAGRVSIGLEPIWEPAFATASIAPAIPALTPIEIELIGELPEKTVARWAYALAAERAGARIKE